MVELRMMDLVKRDGVDLLLFCRLDRWFRSVADYYKVMEVKMVEGVLQYGCLFRDNFKTFLVIHPEPEGAGPGNHGAVVDFAVKHNSNSFPVQIGFILGNG